jgi:amino acid adenylation domain-containing protein
VTTERPTSRLALPLELMESVTAVARAEGCDEETVLVAAVSAAMYRYDRTENRRLRTGATTVRVEVTDDVRFSDLLAQVSESRKAPAPADDADPDGIVHVRLSGDPAAVLDVQGGFLPAGGGPAWGTALGCLLRHALADPAERVGVLRMLPPDEQERLIDAVNATAVAAAPPRTVHHLFEQLATEDADRIALITADGTVSYGQLNARAERLAAHLTALGAGPEQSVAIHVERSPQLVVAVLATLKCGAAFVPFDRRMPRERITDILESSRTRLVIGDEDVQSLLRGIDVVLVTEQTAAASPRTARPGREVSVDNAAYIYFTSGSTGIPKGVVTDHRCAANRIDWIVERYGLGAGSVVLHKTPLIFDVAIIEIMAPLTAGAAVRIAEPHGEADVGHLTELLQGGDVTFVHFVPSVLKAFLSGVADTAFPGVRWVQTSGEAVPTRLLDGLMERFGNAVFHSAYGQTETSEVAVWEGRRYTAGPQLPVGRPIGSYRLFILDDDLAVVPSGVPGEICVAGVGGLARGYHEQPALTAEHFVPHPYPLVPGERLYRTGDLGAYDDSGQILFLGRKDSQAKIRGARVEPAEVEAVLAEGPSVKDCAVVVRRDEQGDNELVAYVVGEDIVVDELAQWAADRLTSYLLPTAYVRMDRLPFTNSGKLDRLILPAPAAADRSVRGEGEAAQSHLEAELCSLWGQILGLPSIGPTDDFFAVGGNSLKVTQVMVRITTLYGVRIPVAAFFEDPTVRGLAVLIERLLVDLVAAMPEEEATRRVEAIRAQRGGS